MSRTRTSLTVRQAIEVLNRSARGRHVARQLHALLDGPAASLDMSGKVAVLALVEEAWINNPGAVLDALSVFVEESP